MPDLSKSIAEFLARAAESIAADEVQLGKELVVAVAQENVLPFHVQARLQQVGPLGHAPGPTRLQIENGRRCGKHFGGHKFHAVQVGVGVSHQTLENIFLRGISILGC